MKALKARCGAEIKAGMIIKHIHRDQKTKVYDFKGVLYGGAFKVSAYHSSVIEIVSK